jgi:hypothetical protein
VTKNRDRYQLQGITARLIADYYTAHVCHNLGGGDEKARRVNPERPLVTCSCPTAHELCGSECHFDPQLAEVRAYVERRGTLPSDPGDASRLESAFFGRHPGDMISSALLLDPGPGAGSMMLHAGWRVEDQTYGAPFGGQLPLPVPLLR